MPLLPPPRPSSVRQRVAFLRELLKAPNATLAAARANVNRGTLYRWKIEDSEFAAVWAGIVAARPCRPRGRRQLETSQLATPVSTSGRPGYPWGINGLAFDGQE